MRKFKIIYYVIYGLFVLLLIYLAANLISVIDTLKDWGWYTYLSELPKIGSRFFYVTATFMTIAVAIENYFTYAKRGEKKKLEQEILNLKAKLYDQASAGGNAPVISEIDQDIDQAPDEPFDDNQEENTSGGE